MTRHSEGSLEVIELLAYFVADKGDARRPPRSNAEALEVHVEVTAEQPKAIPVKFGD